MFKWFMISNTNKNPTFFVSFKYHSLNCKFIANYWYLSTKYAIFTQQITLEYCLLKTTIKANKFEPFVIWRYLNSYFLEFSVFIRSILHIMWVPIKIMNLYNSWKIKCKMRRIFNLVCPLTCQNIHPGFSLWKRTSNLNVVTLNVIGIIALQKRSIYLK